MENEEVGQAFWDERYGGTPALWSGQPNHFLVAEVADLVPGQALDVGCGEGADTIWLAKRGWDVTGTDISIVALERAKRLAEGLPPEVAGRMTWLHADIMQWEPPRSAYDLVSAQYFHGPLYIRQAVWPKLIGAVAPGGTLLVVAHDPEDPHVREHHHERPERFYSATEIAERLPGDEWAIAKNVSEGRTRQGDETHFLDLVFRATRKSPTP